MALADRTVTLAWDANAPAEIVTSYAVIIDGKELPPVTGTTAAITIPDTRTTVSVVAISDGGRSEPSAPLIIPAAPSNPKGVRVTSIVRTTISTP